MKEIVLSKTLALPADAVTQTLACIGRKGAGKTYLASILAEQMLDIQAQVVIIDPVGNWFGLRVASDGKSKGKDIFIAGGERGDVPILPEAGARFAKLVVEKNVSMILDVSSFRQGERKRFAADFAEEFFHLKKSQRSAVHLFVEEAQLFAPQRTGPEEARMLGAFENIIRLGRNYGIGATLITQRPQSVNKEVLSQVECLCVLQVNGSHERKALEEWVQEAGADRKLVGELPGLARGEGYVWSPSWLRIFQRVKFGQKTTFDASATPEVGRQAKAALLSSVDVEALKADLQEVIAKVEKDDPKALRRRIAELERVASTAVNPRVEQELERVTAALQEAHGTIDMLQVKIGRERDRSQQLQGYVDAIMKIQVAVDALKPIDQFVIPKTYDIKRVQMDTRMKFEPKLLPTGPKVEQNGNRSGHKLPKAERSILTVLAQYGPSSKAKVAAIAGYAVTGGGFNNALGALRSKGFLQGSDVLDITKTGDDALGSFAPLPSGTDLLDYWKRKLPKAERSIIDALWSCSVPIPKEMLAKSTGYEVTGGGFNNALGSLRTLELIEGSRELRLKPDFAEALGL